jgi:hypothetical protein
LGPYWCHYGEYNRLWVNDGKGRFRDISASNAAFCGQANVARGLAYGDFDNDGAVDVLVTYIAGAARLYRNVAPKRGHWLLLRVVDPALKRDAYGAEITVRTQGPDGRSFTRWLNLGSSYLCSNDPRVHFGLGESDKVEAVEVLWPDGQRETFSLAGVDRSFTLQKGEGRPLSSR